MHSIEWVRDPKYLEGIADDWRLLERSITRRTHLSTYDFMATWYRNYAGEYGGMPLIGLARRGARLVGVAPLTIGRGTVGRIPLTRIEFAPSDAPAGEFLVADEDGDVVAALLDDLIAHATFDIISLDGFAPGCAQLAAIEERASRHGCVTECIDHAYAYADLRDGYEAYRARLTGHCRRNLNQKARRIADAGGATVDMHLFSVADPDRCVARIVAITEASYKLGGARLADHHRAFLREIVGRLSASRTLGLPILSIGGTDAAFILGMVERGVFYDITLAYADTFEKLSPGSFLMQHTLDVLASRGIRMVVSHGAHEYKRHWATAFVPQKRIFVFRPGIRTAAARFVRFTLSRLSQRFGAAETPSA
jgi:CelD/BcsL family acetyltransferase involved in cellulose biosynthesis